MTEEGRRFFDWAGGDAEKLAERCATSEKVIAQLQDELWKEQERVDRHPAPVSPMNERNEA